MPTNAIIQFQAAAFPEGTCFLSEQERANAIAENLIGHLPGTFNSFVIGSSTPAAEDQDKPWIADDGRVYLFDLPGLGAWVARHPLPVASVMMWTGDISAIDTFDGGETGVVGVASGPMWEVMTAMAGRFPIHPGTMDSGAIIGQGATGGAERHTLTLAEIPTHSHDVPLRPTEDPGTTNLYADRARANAAEPTDLLPTSEVGDGDPHNNMPPYFGIYFIRRSARVWYRK